ncbi:MAG: histidine--tRNA ligase [Alphaproteobacteria bacterium]|nr:histidine--tRNA ligase [Alphaproteobacteria bacterium]MBN2674994.1 histidine--tRNA ligase [Alphaproteobacteria bacterium]
MNLKPTKPLSGFIELLPIQQRCFDECARRMQNVLKIAGFTHLDLPAIERAEVLTDKDNWDEIETQMFMFQKGETKMGLRYDGTVGLARYVSGNMSNLTFPFRAYQFARNYRGERPQRGRYREFYQIDLDVLGQCALSENYDAEIVAVLSKAYESIQNFVGPTKIRVGNRRFWNAMFEYLELNEKQSRSSFILIDKKDKLDDFIGALSEEIGKEKADSINKVFIDGYSSFRNKSINLDSAISDLDNFMLQLSAMGINNAEIDLGIMRGHAYYTGIVFEFFLTKFPELGAVGGGGRYEDLVSKFSKTKIIGVGAAVGFSRLMVALMDDNKIDLSGFEQPISVSVLIMGQDQVVYSMSVLAALRDAEITAIPYLDTDKKFKNQIEFSDKIKSKFSIIIGEDEVKNQILAVKNMKTGDQQNLSLSCAIEMLKIAK